MDKYEENRFLCTYFNLNTFVITDFD